MIATRGTRRRGIGWPTATLRTAFITPMVLSGGSWPIWIKVLGAIGLCAVLVDWLVAARDPWRRSLHDRVAHTRVVCLLPDCPSRLPIRFARTATAVPRRLHDAGFQFHHPELHGALTHLFADRGLAAGAA